MVQGNERIVQCNHTPVASGIHQNTGQITGHNLKIVYLNMKRALLSQQDKLPSKIGSLHITNIILGKDLNVLYYDVMTYGENQSDTSVYGVNRFPDVNEVVDKVLTNDKLINPNGLTADQPYYRISVRVNYKEGQ